ncbi:MAG: hypothetical protein VW842_08060, partial [Halieaceae bacterium]
MIRPFTGQPHRSTGALAIAAGGGLGFGDATGLGVGATGCGSGGAAFAGEVVADAPDRRAEVVDPLPAVAVSAATLPFAPAADANSGVPVVMAGSPSALLAGTAATATLGAS